MNRIEGLRRLLEAGEGCGAAGANRLGPGGEINRAGTGASLEAYLRRPGDADFLANIEPGVAPLVRIMTERLGWLTYTSCEGHRGPPLRERHLGLVARTPAEGAAMVNRLAPACRRANLGARHVRLALTLIAAETELGPWPCLDLYFHAMTQASPEAYFAAADRLQARLVARLEAGRPLEVE